MITTTDIIKKSIDLYKENFKLFLSYSLLLMVPSLIISIGGITSAFLFAGLNNLGVAFALFLVLAISMGLFSIWVGMSFIKVIVMRYVGTEAQSIQSNLGSTVRLILPSLWVSILTGLAVMGGMILLIIPGIIFAVWFGFGMYALVLENKRGTDALKYSKSLVSGRWFGVFWRLVAPVLVFIIIVGIAQWIVGIPFGSSLQSETATAGTFVYIILSSILSLLITPLTTIAPTILYQELKKTPLAPQAPESSEVPTA
ncbi:MAG: hypothetical protein HYV41_01265 [Candidatus Magasanikbacteria bacterium]|nr:hypothetical protein [Candidatus Magasanikbacteria bacterium]